MKIELRTTTRLRKADLLHGPQPAHQVVRVPVDDAPLLPQHVMSRFNDDDVSHKVYLLVEIEDHLGLDHVWCKEHRQPSKNDAVAQGLLELTWRRQVILDTRLDPALGLLKVAQVLVRNGLGARIVQVPLASLLLDGQPIPRGAQGRCWRLRFDRTYKIQHRRIPRSNRCNRWKGVAASATCEASSAISRQETNCALCENKYSFPKTRMINNKSAVGMCVAVVAPSGDENSIDRAIAKRAQRLINQSNTNISTHNTMVSRKLLTVAMLMLSCIHVATHQLATHITPASRLSRHRMSSEQKINHTTLHHISQSKNRAKTHIQV